MLFFPAWGTLFNKRNEGVSTVPRVQMVSKMRRESALGCPWTAASSLGSSTFLMISVCMASVMLGSLLMLLHNEPTRQTVPPVISWTSGFTRHMVFWKEWVAVCENMHLFPLQREHSLYTGKSYEGQRSCLQQKLWSVAFCCKQIYLLQRLPVYLLVIFVFVLVFLPICTLLSWGTGWDLWVAVVPKSGHRIPFARVFLASLVLHFHLCCNVKNNF